MQHLNEDMDDLFRKAADDYPLNTDTADWNKIAEGLQLKTPARNPKDRRYRRYAWLLLLLPLGFIAKEIFDPVFFKSGPLQSETRTGNSDTDDNTAEPDAIPGGSDDSATILKQSLNTDEQKVPDPRGPGELSGDGNSAKSAAGISDKTGLSDKTGNRDKKGINDKTDINDKNDNSNKTGTAIKGKKPTEVAGAAGNGQNEGLSADTKAGSNKRNIPPGNRAGRGSSAKKALLPPAGIALSNNDVERPVKSSGENDMITEQGNRRIAGSQALEPAASDMESSAGTGLVPVAASPNVSADPAAGTSTIQAGPITKQKPGSKKFYLGAVGGLDVTTIKFQETSKIGNHFGAVAGYSFARKWSVEVGFFVEKKYYYTDGKYFDRSKMNLNPNTTIISVDGECKMFEIPVSVKYDITNTYKSNFFVTGGLSSYIMKQEDYTMVWGYASGSRRTHYYPYKNSSKNFFAELRITGGYALKLPKDFSVRIEPYLNIPVTGVGYGKLNLMSAGLNGGIFRRLF